MGRERLFKCVGRNFEAEDAGDTFNICGVCDMGKVGSRKSGNIFYALEYVSISGDQSDFEYTPARELNSYWCKWIQPDVVLEQAARASMRVGDQSIFCFCDAYSFLPSVKKVKNTRRI